MRPAARATGPASRTALRWARAAASAAAIVRLARGRRRLPPLTAEGTPVPGRVSVIIPARNEEGRLGPCLRAIRADPNVAEVLVIDDESTDGTAATARCHGARVLPGTRPPPGWVGKQWALQQGIREAGCEWVLALDADTRPEPGLAAAVLRAAAAGGYDLLSVTPRFRCDGVAEQALHASMLATLVYRFGPVGLPAPPAGRRTVVNGQCLLFRGAALRDQGGFALARDRMTDDVAMGRGLAARGWRVRLLDGGPVLSVDMHGSAGEVWTEWGRTLPMSDVTAPVTQAADLAVIWLAMALPGIRLATGRGGPLDAGMLALRLALLGALRRSYLPPRRGMWLSPLCDVAAAWRLTAGTLRPVRTWRGRRYGAPTLTHATSTTSTTSTAGRAATPAGSAARGDTSALRWPRLPRPGRRAAGPAAR